MIEWMAALSAMSGAFLVTSRRVNIRLAGFYSFLFANVTWIIWSIINDQPALAVQNVVFTVAAIIGIRNSIKEGKSTSSFDV